MSAAIAQAIHVHYIKPSPKLGPRWSAIAKSGRRIWNDNSKLSEAQNARSAAMKLIKALKWQRDTVMWEMGMLKDNSYVFVAVDVDATYTPSSNA